MPSKYSTRYSLSDELQLLVVYAGDTDMKIKNPIMKAIINTILRDKRFFLNYLELRLSIELKINLKI